MEYKEKYLKYKKKYLDLKQDIFTQSGGIKGKYLALKQDIFTQSGGIKEKYLALKQIGGSMLNFDNSRMIENCNLCYNNSIIYLFYSIPEFRLAIASLGHIENTNKAHNSKHSDIDINSLLIFIKGLFNLMDKTKPTDRDVDEDFICCTKDFYRQYTKFIKDFYILAFNNFGYKYENNTMCSDSGEIIHDFTDLDAGKMSHINVSLFNFMNVFSQILEEFFCYYIDPSNNEKVFLIEKGAPYYPKKYMITPPSKKEDGSYDYINILEYKIDIGTFSYELVGVLSGVYISKKVADEHGMVEGIGGHYWLDLYEKTIGQFTMVNDLEDNVKRGFERDKNPIPNSCAGIGFLIYRLVQ